MHLALADATDRDSRSRPSRVAPCGGRGGTRRGRRARAGALGRPCAGARRPRRRGGVPAARRRADREPGATRRQSALRPRGASLQAGAFDAALGLLATAEAEPLDELQRARVELLRGQHRVRDPTAARRAALLLPRARRLERLDVELARETYLDAWRAAQFAGRLGGGEDCRHGRAGGAFRSARGGRPAFRPPARRLRGCSVTTAVSPRLQLLEGDRALRRNATATGTIRWTWLDGAPARSGTSTSGESVDRMVQVAREPAPGPAAARTALTSGSGRSARRFADAPQRCSTRSRRSPRRPGSRPSPYGP